MSLAALAASCASSREVGAVEDWKKTALAECEKKTDLIARTQCEEQVKTVSTERAATQPAVGQRAR